MRRLPVLGCLTLAPLLLFRFAGHSDPLPEFPRLMLWAWETPQDLRFIKPGSAGIAFLARTVRLAEGSVRAKPRLQPMLYQPGVELMAVVRMESAGGGLPAPADAVRETLTAVASPDVRALQIDFDARESERSWYAAFLRDLRNALPARLPLTITALESWCEEDTWVRGLPVVEATPMLFRMGPGENRSPVGFRSAVCSSSAGVSTDELPARVPPARRLYFFHPGSWTPQAYDAAVAQAARWRK